MTRLNGTLFVTILMLLTALTLSGVAAWFSVVGLIAIFAASPFSIAVMAGTLEVAKLVCASWVYNHWHAVPRLIKAYLTAAVVVLMFITSMGIFGYLSKAHLDQGVPTSEVAAKVQLIDEKIQIQQDNLKVQRDNIATARTALGQMDAQVGASLDRTTTASGADRSVSIRRQQAGERRALQAEIARAQTEIEKINAEIAKLREEKAPIASELRKVEAEVGPIKYIAALIYGDQVQDDVTTLEKAVRWVTILLVVVFDPLAVIMLIAANYGMRNFREEKKDELHEKIQEIKQELEEAKAELKEATEESLPEPKVEEPKAEPEPAKDDSIDPALEAWNKIVAAAEAETLREAEEKINAWNKIVEEKKREQEALVQAADNALEIAELPAAEHQVVDKNNGYVEVDGKLMAKPAYEALKAAGEMDLVSSVVSAQPLEGISLERVKDLIHRIERDEISIDDLTLPEREAVRKYLESNG